MDHLNEKENYSTSDQSTGLRCGVRKEMKPSMLGH